VTTTPTPTPPAPATTASNIADDVTTILDDGAAAMDTITTASLWTAVIGFFTALPGIIALIQDVWSWANKISGGNPGTLIANAVTGIRALLNAKTTEDTQSATQNLANLFNKLPGA
jgi:hypothetical protein